MSVVVGHSVLLLFLSNHTFVTEYTVRPYQCNRVIAGALLLRYVHNISVSFGDLYLRRHLLLAIDRGIRVSVM